MTDEHPWLVAMRVSDARVVSENSKRGYYCSECGEEIWLSPFGLVAMDAKGAWPICNQCATAMVSDEDEFAPPSDEQMAEVNAFRAMLGQPPISKEAMAEIARKNLTRAGD